MLKSIQQRDLERNRWIKITMGVILGLIICSMVVTLIPGLLSGAGDVNGPDTIASIGGQNITNVQFQQQFDQLTRNQSVPPLMRGIYARQILDEMIFQRALAYEAGRLGLGVTDQEETQRIKQILPSAWAGDTWLKDRYENEVETKTGMTVAQFEELLRSQMLEEKFRQLVTDGLTVSPAEIAQEFRWRNEKVKLDYALLKPADLAATIHPSDAELAAWFNQNVSRYQIPEKRSARYVLLDLGKLRASTQVSDDTLRAYYNANIDQYKVENRAHVEHILFKTVGKTDAEVAEIRQKAEDVLKQAKKGANFEDLAKKYSEDDASKPKGGDLGWILEGQTVPEFQQAAFSLPKGSISDLVKTQYGFHIIKVLDRETAHTKSFEEVRDSILQPVLNDKVNAEASDLSDQMAAAVRQSDRQSSRISQKNSISIWAKRPRSPSPIPFCRSVIPPTCTRRFSNSGPANSAPPFRSKPVSSSSLPKISSRRIRALWPRFTIRSWQIISVRNPLTWRARVPKNCPSVLRAENRSTRSPNPWESM